MHTHWLICTLIAHFEHKQCTHKLLNVVSDVAFKLLIDKIELVDNKFKLFNTDVAFKLFIDKVEKVENEFKLLNIVVDVAFSIII